MTAVPVVIPYTTGLSLWWYPVSRALSLWDTYKVEAVESGSSGKYTATLDTTSADTDADAFATFLLFENDAQPGTYDENVYSVSLYEQLATTTSSSSSGDTSSTSEPGVVFSDLQQEVGEKLFGLVTGWDTEQLRIINRCIKHGIDRVYSMHDWSFFRPVYSLSTEANKSEYNLPEAFESVENGILTFAGTNNECYPPVREVHDVRLRRMQQGYGTDTNRPYCYSVRMDVFDPRVGSRRKLILHPTPDAVYTLQGVMVLRRLPVNSDNPHPIGAEQLSQLMIEACLSAAELAYDEKPGPHEALFQSLLPNAIRQDELASSPKSLGGDAPRGSGRFSVFGDEYRLREQRIGILTLGGDAL